VQEWIHGGDDRVAFGLGYWNARSQPLALFPGRKIRQWPPECGNTALSERAPPEWRDELASLTEKIYDAVGYRGLGSIEYKVSPGGRLVIMEPTVGRTNYQNEVAVLNGVNLPAIAYFDGVGMQSDVERMMDRARQDPRATKLIDTPADYRSARFYIAESRLTWRAWWRSRRGPKRDMLFRLRDPAPAIVSSSRALASFIKHRILKPVLRPLLRSR
jgi:predicted ATP-grasp superfamily ATP-dependent carboligase